MSVHVTRKQDNQAHFVSLLDPCPCVISVNLDYLFLNPGAVKRQSLLDQLYNKHFDHFGLIVTLIEEDGKRIY